MSDNTDTSQSIIHQLPPEVSNKIAAGEVIQRPASVVKELLDNAIDAGADQIKIVIQNAGRTLIQVIDNGCGMGEEDIRLCFEQHATSKINSVDDLFRVRTLGFRGEAMASIASVSQVKLKSKRPEDEMGYEYEIWGGEEKEFKPAAVDNGTSVAVRNLFYNVPARRQFLKTDATEFRHILKTIQQAALGHPDIGFNVIADTDEIYDLTAGQPMKERIAAMFGKSYKASLIEFKEETSYVTVRGILSDPKLTKKSRGEQFLFVNDRPFQHRYLTHVALSIYDPWMGDNEYPFFAIFLDIDPQQVDVNVHPAKEEVKFEDERSIIKLVKSVVKKALNEHFMVPQVDREEGKGRSSGFDSGFSSNFNFKSGGSSGRSHRSRQSGPVRIPSRINRESSGSTNKGDQFAQQLYQQKGSAEEEQKSSPKSKPDHRQERNFWQLHNSYILTQTRSGLCMIDQHAAHKRIIYEKALNATESALPSTQQLLFAQTVELSATDFSLLKELHGIMQRMGFNIQLMSGNTAMINGVPADIDIGDEQSVLKSMLHQYQELEGKMDLDERHKLAVAFASKTAINKGKHLTNEEMEGLIDQLFACQEPYNDPLKKPTIVYIGLEDIESRFR
ncbi:DNA mismatch repair endonuclease MutL [Aliifodinibius sp. S!AR15-10]|uniref:DNA mismatch repair endonuclease MutL n=1 Tax=Aliifodinibius sp. S!AR15-10 TaxID=2950437 RepID=UPI0028638CF5|nr:DNA mismatch repair endonuclease MutL [Aliifodinibius sp. S!AR15-10]MDR8394135.1 DNA mismatch repair endonuclease MutL [Aliifodinibius sp. S!AR15-10]